MKKRWEWCSQEYINLRCARGARNWIRYYNKRIYIYRSLEVTRNCFLHKFKNLLNRKKSLKYWGNKFMIWNWENWKWRKCWISCKMKLFKKTPRCTNCQIQIIIFLKLILNYDVKCLISKLKLYNRMILIWNSFRLWNRW